MDLQQIKAFMDAMASSDLDEMEVSHEGWTLRLARNTGPRPGHAPPPVHAPTRVEEPAPRPAAATPTPARPPEAKGPHAILAPMFGVVHLQQAPGEPPFVKPGDAIEAGQLLCTIEAMKVFNEVRAEQAGRVAAVLATSGAEVEAGQPLMTLERVDHV